MVITALQSVLMLLTLILTGCFAASRPWFGETGSALFSKFTVQIAIPCYMFYNVWNTCGSREKLLEMFSQLPIPFCIILLGLAMGFLLARVCRIPLAKRGVFINAVAFSNTVIIGFPVVEALFGEAGLPQGMVYYMANTVLFWTVGVFLLHKDHDPAVRLFSLSGLRSILAPPLMGFLLGAATVLADFHLPDFLMSAITMIKQMATPMAMIFIGSMIYKGGLQSFRPCKELLLVIACRFILTPMVVLLICLPMGLSADTLQIFFILATMPAMTQLGIMANEAGSDSGFASVIITVTTVISLAAIPVYVFLLQQLLSASGPV